MSDPWEAEVFRVPDISWQTQPPPVRHPVPAQYVADLEVGDELTVGVPGRFFVDGQVLALPERRRTTLAGATEEGESLAVAAPYAYWLAKAYPRTGLTMQWWPVGQAWVYRDAVAPGEQPLDVSRRPDAHTGSWLDHVRLTLHEPPVREPRPARLADSLMGRTLRLQHERGAWSWWIAVSEPLDRGGDFVVQIMRQSDYWLAQALYDATERIQTVPLYRLFLYA